MFNEDAESIEAQRPEREKIDLLDDDYGNENSVLLSSRLLGSSSWNAGGLKASR